MKKLITLFLMLTVTASMFSACKKGDTGPAGANGNANVQSITITVNSGQWIYDSSTNGYDVNIPDAAITQDILSNGAVIVYLYSNATYVALPYSVENYSFGIGLNVGNVQIDVSDNNGYAIDTPNSGSFKIVAIAGSARKMMQQNNIDERNYQAVKTYLKLKD